MFLAIRNIRRLGEDTLDPLYSVIIPTFNRARLVCDAIDSILEQGVERERLQVIVVDDGSTDGTEAEVLARYGGDVRYTRQPNQGAAAARNQGLALATGELVAFLDSDDVWLPGKIAAELALFTRHPEVDGVISDSEFWEVDRLVTPSRFRSLGLEASAGQDAVPLSAWPPRWLRQSIVSTCCITFRREVLARIGLPAFKPSLPTHEDWEFEIRLYNCCTVMALPQVLARIRRFPDDTRRSRGSLRRQLQLRYEILRQARNLPLRNAEADRAAREMQCECARRLAREARGWQRAECLPLAVRELRQGAALNALQVLGLGLLPRHRG
jgi:glycosyltransferase involved in cell wall biosynthesis